MKPELIALAKSLGLDPETAKEEDILAAAQKSHEALQALQTDIASVKKALGLEEDAEISEAVELASTQPNMPALPTQMLR